MTTLRDLLLQAPLPNGAASFHTLPGAGKPSLSQKNWVQNYPEVNAIRPLYLNPTRDYINAAFGDEDALDAHLLDKGVSPLNGTTEWLQKEGDSVRAFYTHVSHAIQLAFQTHHGTPFIIQRSESGPLGHTDVNQTVDFAWGCGERCLLIGELKRHGIIDVERWTGESPTDTNRRWLGKELRGPVFGEGSSVCLWNGDVVWAKPTGDRRIRRVVIVRSSVDDTFACSDKSIYRPAEECQIQAHTCTRNTAGLILTW